MKLTDEESALFYSVWMPLLYGVNVKHNFSPRFPKPNPKLVKPVHSDQALPIRDKIWDEPQLIDEFLADPELCSFNEAERKIVLDIRAHFLKETFILTEHLPKYSVMMMTTGDEESTRLYGVLGLGYSIKASVLIPPPVLVTTVLLPFQGKIIYDGMGRFTPHQFTEKELDAIFAIYRATKRRFGIFESLNSHSVAPLERKKKSAVSRKKTKRRR
ncbi:MAG: hypothetical protein LBI10_11985 [Deltaproteobacteria bacterium]|jgi:hypothetical protein|nr:hypothetical protein [Deltaproteobacteria bacterium]